MTPRPAFFRLVWELWHPHRWGIVSACLVVPLTAWVAGHIAPAMMESNAVDGSLPLLFLCGLLYLLAILAYAEFSTQAMQTGFPTHVLRLPVASGTLATVPLGFGVLVLSAYALAWFGLGLIPLKVEPALVLITILISVAWMQALNWGLAQAPVAAGLILIGVVGATGLALATLATRPELTTLVPREIAGLTLALLALSGIGLARLAVRRARRSELFLRGLALPEIRLPGFSIPQRMPHGPAAQFRLEWRMFGWILPATAAFLGLLALGVRFLPPEAAVEASLLLVAIFIYVAGAQGMELAKSQFRKNDYEIGGFCAIRPLSDAGLAWAKLKLVGAALLLGWLLFMVPLAATWLTSDQQSLALGLWDLLAAREGPVIAWLLVLSGVFLLPLLAWVMAANLLAGCLSGHRFLGGRAALLIGPVCLAIAWSGYEISRNPTVVRFLLDHAPLVGLLPAVFMVALAAHFLKRAGKNLRSVLPIPLACGAGVILLVLMLGIWNSGLLADIRPLASVIAANLVLASLLPVVVAPVAVGFNRHR